jgi:hypothetical protein
MSLLLALVLSAPGITLAAPDFNTANVSAETARFCAEHLATELTARGVRVITSREISSVLGMERQRQLLGCSDSSTSCLTELSDALGADGLLLGDLGRVGKRFQLNVRVVRAGGDGVITSLSVPIASEDDLLPELTKAAGRLAGDLKAALHPTSKTAPVEVSRSVHRWPLWPTVLAGVFLATGVTLHLVANAQFQSLTVVGDVPLNAMQANTAHDVGVVTRDLGWVGYGLAVASVGVATFLMVRGEPVAVQPVVAVGAQGGLVGVSGVFP